MSTRTWTAFLPPSVAAQHGLLPGVLQAHGFTVVVGPGPVHLAASYVQAALEAGFDAMVVATDKRLAQLVAGDVWWYDPYKRVRYTPELVHKRFEVAPAQVAGWLALVGDRESLPGVAGIGKKGATALVQEQGSVEAAIAGAADLEGRLGKALRASLSAAKQELGRATLDRRRRLPVPLSALRWQPPQQAGLNALYAELGYHQLLRSEGPQGEAVVCDGPEAVRAMLATLSDQPTAVLAVTEDPSPARGELVGLCLSQGEQAFYVPAEALDSLVPWLRDPDRPKIGHATKSVVVALTRRGIAFEGIVGDSESESHLFGPTGLAPHDLPDLARQCLHAPVEAQDVARGVGKHRKDWGALPAARIARHVGPWTAASAKLHALFSPSIDPSQLREYLALSQTLARMELHGIACDAADLVASATEFSRVEAEVEAAIHELAGRSFNVGSTRQLGAVLFDELGLTVISRTKTGWSTASSALERIAHEHPIVPLVMRWRAVRWLRGTWAEALAQAIDADGRVHATFHHARSFSGRIICSSPDLGRVPGRTREMTRIRHAFHAPPGSTLLSVDYDQLGLYVLAHLSGDTELVSALSRGDDLHRITAAAVLQRRPDEIDAELRQIGKVVNFATFAGQGASALALQLDVPAAEAKAIIARFYDHYAGVREFQDAELAKARSEGFIETIAGRRQRVGGFDSRDAALAAYAERVGRRATHEGSVADITRRALLDSDVALRAAGLRAFPVLQLLDEVLFEVPQEELEQTLRVTANAMRSTYALRVPLRVTAKAGARWGALQPLEVPPD